MSERLPLSVAPKPFSELWQRQTPFRSALRNIVLQYLQWWSFTVQWSDKSSLVSCLTFTSAFRTGIARRRWCSQLCAQSSGFRTFEFLLLIVQIVNYWKLPLLGPGGSFHFYGVTGVTLSPKQLWIEVVSGPFLNSSIITCNVVSLNQSCTIDNVITFFNRGIASGFPHSSSVFFSIALSDHTIPPTLTTSKSFSMMILTSQLSTVMMQCTVARGLRLTLIKLSASKSHFKLSQSAKPSWRLFDCSLVFHWDIATGLKLLSEGCQDLAWRCNLAWILDCFTLSGFLPSATLCWPQRLAAGLGLLSLFFPRAWRQR